MTTRAKAAISGVLSGLAFLALTASPLFAQTSPATPATPSGPMAGVMLTHEQMHQMMDMMHGPGTSQRMHAAMGPEVDRLMEECVAMMGMMQNMQGMQGMMQMMGMMGGGGMSGTMRGQNGQSMQDMMRGMMGR